MHPSTRHLHRISTSTQSDVFRAIADYRFLAPAALAARERHEAMLAFHAARCAGHPSRRSLLGQVRRWLGAQLRRRADASTQPDTALPAIAASQQLVLALATGMAFGLTIHDAGAVAGRAPDPRRHAVDVAVPDPLTPSAVDCSFRQPCPTPE